MPIELSPPHSPSFSAGAARDSHSTQSSPLEVAGWNPVDACANWLNVFDPDTGSGQLSRYAGSVPVPAHMNDVDALLPRLSLSSVQEPGNSRSNPDTDDHIQSDTDGHIQFDTDDHTLSDTDDHIQSDTDGHIQFDTDDHTLSDTDDHILSDTDEPEPPSLAQTLRKWVSAGVNVPSLEGAAEGPEADSFNTWLIGLESTADYKSDETLPLLQQRVATLLQEMETDPDLRKLCFGCAQEAISTCGDRITLGLHNMEMAVINRRAELGHILEPELLQLGQGMHRLELLDNVARKINLHQISLRHLMQINEIVELAESYAKLRSSPSPEDFPNTFEEIIQHETQVAERISTADLPDTPEVIEQHVQQALERTEQAASFLLEHYRKEHHYSLNTSHAAADQTRFLASLEERVALADRALEQIYAHYLPERGEFVPLHQRPPRFYPNEAVEIYLALQVELKERLNLPVHNQNMLYFGSANLTSDAIDAAENYVLEEYSDSARQVDFLSQWMPMQKHLERKHQDECKKLCGFYDDEMNALTEQGPGEHETENRWIERMDSLSTRRSNAIARFYREHVSSLLHSRP